MSDTYIRTFDTGVVRPVYKGDWDAETQYEYLNIVRHNDELWMDITTADTPVGDEPLSSGNNDTLSASGEWHRLSANVDAVFGLTAENIDELWNFASDPEYENRVPAYIEPANGVITIGGVAASEVVFEATITEDSTAETTISAELKTIGGVAVEEIVEITEGD